MRCRLRGGWIHSPDHELARHASVNEVGPRSKLACLVSLQQPVSESLADMMLAAEAEWFTVCIYLCNDFP